MLKDMASLTPNHNSIHSVTRPVLFATRCIGLFPVAGLMTSSPSRLKFVLKSPYTLFVLANLTGQLVLSLLSLLNLFEAGSSPRTIYKFVINLAGVVCTFIMLSLARQWPAVVHQVTVIEKSLPKVNQKNIGTACNIAAALVFLGATYHILSIRFYWKLTDACRRGNSHVESYYLYTMPSVSRYIPYNPVLFALMQIVTIQVVFVANFTDVIIIIISLYLTAYFEELNDLINLYKDKSPSIWNVLRTHYTKLTRVVKIIDDNVNFFVLVSFGCNMALICVQLFKILRKGQAHDTEGCNDEKFHETLTGFDRAAYFNFSIAFLIARAVLTALFATKVHKAGRAPLLALYEVPSNCYSSETRRFVDQMHANTIALSGQHFFYVTRGMILTMVATIFTYELVLLQFSDCKK